MNRVEILQKNQKELKQYLKEILIKKGYENKIINTDQYLFGIGKIPILLVAHLDTVHKELPKEVFYDKKKNVMWSPQGIGGDDRCGVFAILEIIEKYNPYVLFTTDEEIGGIGAEKFTNDILLDLKQEVNFIIEIDRQGCNDAVFYDCGNKEFIDYITSFGFEEAFGTFSDISILSPAYDIASVNLSSGYYNAHTKQEYIDLTELGEVINTVCLILEDTENHKPYDYQQIEYKYTTNNYKDTFNSYLVEDFSELNNKDFKDYYGFDKPATLNEFLDMMGV